MFEFFKANRRYLRTDLDNAGSEFRCLAVAQAPHPGAIGLCAFGFEIHRGDGQLHLWLPSVKMSTDGSVGQWSDAGAA